MKSMRYCFTINSSLAIHLILSRRKSSIDVYLVNQSLSGIGSTVYKISVPDSPFRYARHCEHLNKTKILCCHEYNIDEDDQFQLPASFLYGIKKLKGPMWPLENTPNSYFSGVAFLNPALNPGKAIRGSQLNTPLPLLQFGVGEYSIQWNL